MGSEVRLSSYHLFVCELADGGLDVWRGRVCEVVEGSKAVKGQQRSE